MSNNTKAASGKVQVGDSAPDFTLTTQNGSTVNLKQLLSNSAVVLYFYPKDDTPGCTKEACSFRDNYEVFKEAGAEVVGISSDSAEAHSQFAQKHRLPFILASDKNGEVRKQYGVPATFGLLPGRVTYIIDQKGIVRHIFSSQFTPEKHIIEALNTLKTIANQ